jgi:hypothetical protein
MNGNLNPKPSDLATGETFPSVTSAPRKPGSTTYVAEDAAMINTKINIAPPISLAIRWGGIVLRLGTMLTRCASNTSPTSRKDFRAVGKAG